MRRLQFTSWYPLEADSVAEHAPEGPAAVQIRRADGLVEYEDGKASAMVCYFYATENAREALAERFEDELDEPGVRGEGRLEFRYIRGSERALALLKRRLYKFHQSFGTLPIFNHMEEED